eukprot:Hpha_TRINITY_DN1803_c0_g1::TRINITY_DN1803_c0_g1_i1::g.170542::m.170542
MAESREVTVKGVGGAVTKAVLPEGNRTVKDLKEVVAQQSGGLYDAAALTLVLAGKVLADDDVPISDAEIFVDGKGMLVAVSKKRKAESAAGGQTPASPATPNRGKRVVLLLRHGQCANEGGTDEQKHLTQAGHRQAASSAEYVLGLFESGRVPTRRMLVHSTSRRATETAKYQKDKLGKGLIVLGNDLLVECDPVKNPWRAEEAFKRIFRAAEGSEDETMVVVAHNNTNLYLLMRAASLPPEFAREAWKLFRLRHASLTVVTMDPSGRPQIAEVGAAGHHPHDLVTWHNVAGPDEGKISRHKVSGRSIVLIPCAQVTNAARPDSEQKLTRRGLRQANATAQYVLGLSTYCISRRATLLCSDSPAAMQTAAHIQESFGVQLIPDPSFNDCPKPEDHQRAELAFLRVFQPPEGSTRDTVIVVGHNRMFVYWILRALHHTPSQAWDHATSVRLQQASMTHLTFSAEGQPRVNTLGDASHLRYRDLAFDDLPGDDDEPEEQPTPAAAAPPSPPVDTLEGLEAEKRAAFEKKDFAACKAIQQRINALKAA